MSPLPPYPPPAPPSTPPHFQCTDTGPTSPSVFRDSHEGAHVDPGMPGLGKGEVSIPVSSLPPPPHHPPSLPPYPTSSAVEADAFTTGPSRLLVVDWWFNVPGTCSCISWADLLGQIYALPTLRQNLQIKLSTSPNNGILTPGRPVPALSL